MNMRASGASDLRKFLHLLILKLLFILICCWYYRYFVSGNIYFQVSNYTCMYTINAVSFH